MSKDGHSGVRPPSLVQEGAALRRRADMIDAVVRLVKAHMCKEAPDKWTCMQIHVRI